MPAAPPVAHLRRRAAIVFAVCGVMLVGLAGRLYGIQVESHERYLAIRENQSHRMLPVTAARGRIVDRHGAVIALSRLDAKSLAIDPARLARPETTLPAICEIAGASLTVARERYAAGLASGGRFRWIQRRISDEQAAKIEAIKDPGVILVSEPRRFYPMGPLAGHLLGVVGIDGDGLSGLELRFEKPLHGTDGERWVEADAHGRYLTVPGLASREPVDGRDLRLTLDAVVQDHTEQTLGRLGADWKPIAAWAIVVDVTNGDVIAMANWPPVDPRNPGAAPMEFQRNRVVTDLFEPGSTFKPFTIATALEEGKVTIADPMHCENGAWRIPGSRRVLHDHHGHGLVTVADVLIKSSNIGTAKIARLCDWPDLYSRMLECGIGRKTGLPLPGESASPLVPVEKWDGAYVVPSLAMGHQVLVSAAQLAQAYMPLVNGGVALPLRLALDPDAPPPTGKQVFKREIIETLLPLFEKVVSDEGTAKRAMSTRWRIGGKTGTSQKIVGGQYSHSQYVCSFVGFGPIENPRYLAVVIVDEPTANKANQFGGTVAAPSVKSILEHALQRAGVPESARPAAAERSARR